MCVPGQRQSGYREAMHADAVVPRTRSRAKLGLVGQVLLWMLALLASLAVFGAYLEPALMVTLGNAIWSCF